MLQASTETSRRVREAYDQRPAPMGPSDVPYTRTFHPQKRKKEEYFVTTVTLQFPMKPSYSPQLYAVRRDKGKVSQLQGWGKQLVDLKCEDHHFRKLTHTFTGGTWLEMGPDADKCPAFKGKKGVVELHPNTVQKYSLSEVGADTVTIRTINQSIVVQVTAKIDGRKIKSQEFMPRDIHPRLEFGDVNFGEEF